MEGKLPDCAEKVFEIQLVYNLVDYDYHHGLYISAMIITDDIDHHLVDIVGF